MSEQKLKHLEWLQQTITQAHIYFQQLQAYTHQTFLQALSNSTLNEKKKENDFKKFSIPRIENFERKSFENSIKLNRAVLHAIFTPALGQKLSKLNSAGMILILNDDSGIGLALASMLKAAGFPAEVFAKLPTLDELSSYSIYAVIDLIGLQLISSLKEAISLNHHAFTTAQSLLPLLQKVDGFYWTLQDTGGDFALSASCGDRVWSAGIAALAKTIQVEYPNLIVKALDVECRGSSAHQIATKIFNELLAGGPHQEIGLRANGERVTLTLLPGCLNKLNQQELLNSLAVQTQGTIIVSGGARGVTADCIIALAKELPLHYVLLGRTPLSSAREDNESKQAHSVAELQALLLKKAKAQGELLTPKQIKEQVDAILAVREINHTLNSIQESGATVEYFDVDIQDSKKVAETVANIRAKNSQIIGLIHGAGVLADKLIVDKTPEKFNRVFNTKIQGLQALLTALENDPLQFICFFSSVAARYGNRGQSDYAMANEVLNKVAQQLAHSRPKTVSNCKNLFVKSINWGPWDSGMVTPELKKAFMQQGIDLLPKSKGTQAFVNELLRANNHEVEVVIGSGLSPVNKPAALQSYVYPIRVNFNEFAYLWDHRINGVVVIPACQALEWFVQASQAIDVDLPFYTCFDLKVLRGIQLPEFKTKDYYFEISVTPRLEGEQLILDMALKDQEGKLRYRAKVRKLLDIEHSISVFPCQLSSSLKPLTPWKWQISEIYQEPFLFHGPAFQVIHKLQEINDQGGSALLKVSPDKFSPFKTCTPLITLDACLQLFRLWVFQHLNKRSLPAKITHYQPFIFDWPEEVICKFNSELVDTYHSVHTAHLYSLDDQLLAVLAGVEVFYQLE